MDHEDTKEEEEEEEEDFSTVDHSVESELWNIFTYYTLHGNPQDPEHLKCNQFVKLARDTDILGRSVAQSPMWNNVSQADVELAFTSAIRRSGNTRRQGSKELLTYSDFLTCLVRLAPRVYPRTSPDIVFHQLLLENLLPLASRRRPESVDHEMQDPEIEDLFDEYYKGLEQIFQFYSEISEQRQRKLDAAKYVKGQKDGVKQRKMRQRHPDDRPSQMLYPEFQKFCVDYKLTTNELISQLQAGDIFLCSVNTEHKASGDDAAPLTYKEFPDVLYRISKMAYNNRENVSKHDKLQALFVVMWKSVNSLEANGRAVSQRANLAAKAGDLNIGGSSVFNRIFMRNWRKDNFRDYLDPSEMVVPEDSSDMLNRILGDDSPLPPPLTQQARESGSVTQQQIHYLTNNHALEENSPPDPFFRIDYDNSTPILQHRRLEVGGNVNGEEGWVDVVAKDLRDETMQQKGSPPLPPGHEDDEKKVESETEDEDEERKEIDEGGDE